MYSLEVVITFKKQLIIIVFLAVVFFVVKSMKSTVRNFDKFAKIPAPIRKKAERSLRLINKTLNEHFMQTGLYTGYPNSIPNHPVTGYKFGDVSMIPGLIQHCPDCIIGADIYKVAAVGNLDDDPDLDIVTIDQDGKIIVLKDDLAPNPMEQEAQPNGETEAAGENSDSDNVNQEM